MMVYNNNATATNKNSNGVRIVSSHTIAENYLTSGIILK